MWGRPVPSVDKRFEPVKTAVNNIKPGSLKISLAALVLCCVSNAALRAETAGVEKQFAQLKGKVAALPAAVNEQKAEARKNKIKNKAAAGPAFAAAAPHGGSGLQNAEWIGADFAHHIVNPADDGSLTFRGVTLYGSIDVGVGYQSHGVGNISPAFTNGTQYLISKQSYHSNFGFAPNGESSSFVGVKGDQELITGVRGVFKVETQFQPTTGQLLNGPQSLVQNNGKGATFASLISESSNNDSSKAGQAFTQIYAGLSSPAGGTITFGRQNSLFLDLVADYDPVAGGGSNAFSLLGNSGTVSSGLGLTETARWDNSIKYRVNYGSVRAALMYKFDQSESLGQAIAGGAGFDYHGFSLDALGSKFYNALAASSLSAANVTAAIANGSIGNGSPGRVNATLSDNTAVQIGAKYVSGPFKFFGGYDYSDLANPSNPFGNSTTLDTGYVQGGYGIYALTANAYTKDKHLQTFWLGTRYAVTPELELTLAYYHEIQNSYYGPANVASYGCSSSQFANCKGTADNVSFAANYFITKRLNLYAGVMLGTVNGGLANGYAAAGLPSSTNPNGSNSAGNIDPAAGLRYQF